MKKIDNGYFVTCEGGEGSGKSSLVKRLYEKLKNDGYDVIKTNDPGTTKIGLKIRKLLLDKQYKLFNSTELFLYYAVRAQLVKEIITPALHEGKIVLCDRFFDSAHVYQGAIRNWDKSVLGFFDSITNETCYPDLTFLCNVDAEIGLKRSLKVNQESVEKNGQDESRWELEGLEIHSRINKAFLDRATSEDEKDRFCILDSNKLTIDGMVETASNFLKSRILKNSLYEKCRLDYILCDETIFTQVFNMMNICPKENEEKFMNNTMNWFLFTMGMDATIVSQSMKMVEKMWDCLKK